jgi:hypothetical protein
MIILRLKGGLGNQLFEYALVRHLSIIQNTEFKFDLHHYDAGWGSYNLGVFNIKESFARDSEIEIYKKFKRKIGRRAFLYNLIFSDKSKYVEEREPFIFDKSIFEVNNCYLDGWWQNEKYFIDIRDILLKELTIKEPPKGRNLDISIKVTETNSVSIHIRRMDFVTNARTKHLYGELTNDYYNRAIDYLSSKVENIKLFIFSDDIEWVKQNMNFKFEKTFIESNNSEDLAYEDLRLMSLCKHHVIANSTFSWWGAWLGTGKDKIVVGPKRWLSSSDRYDTSDLMPKEWIRL